MTASARARNAAAKLDAWRDDIAALYRRRAWPGANLLVLQFVARYGLRQEDFIAVLDGMVMDVADGYRAPPISRPWISIATGSPAPWGGCRSRMFGMEEGARPELAHHLAAPRSSTNILRDIDEDAAIGRLYLPREYLFELFRAAPLTPTDRRTSPRSTASAWQCRCRWRIRHYEAAQKIMAARPKGRIAHPSPDGRGLFRDPGWKRDAGFAPPRRGGLLCKRAPARLVVKHGLGRKAYVNGGGMCGSWRRRTALGRRGHGESRAVRSRAAGGRSVAAPISIPTIGSAIDNVQSPGAVGQSRP